MPLPRILASGAVPMGALAPVGSSPSPPLGGSPAPLGGAGNESNRLAFAIERQTENNWCWAAVTVSVAKFYDSSSTHTQCGIVNGELGETSCCVNGSSPECDKPWYLDAALRRTNNLDRWDDGANPFADVMVEIRGGRPLGARIGWMGGGGHFVVISGYTVSGSSTFVDVEDPWHGSSRYDYSQFCTTYMTTGSWTHSYWTRR